MTPEIEKKRREVFEAWLSQKIGGRYIPGLDNRRGADGEYVYAPAASYWAGFNAALDAVEIELPGIYEYHSTSGMRRGCEEAITATDLGIRIKE